LKPPIVYLTSDFVKGLGAFTVKLLPGQGLTILSAAMSDLKARVFDQKLSPFERLCLLMEILLSEEGCAWDRAQDHKSLLPYLIEETYEVVEAVESGDPASLKEELGDLACQIVFHAQLAREQGDFDIDDSLECIVDKLVTRHPHVFGEKRKLVPKQVCDQWERIKTKSRENRSALAGVPGSMPALTMAFRVGEKAAGVGFDWTNIEDVLEKVDEELSELREVLNSAPSDRKERLHDEIGDLLFAVASAARKLEIDPESALRKALKKFKTRFQRLETQVSDERGNFDDYTLDELEQIWQSVKRHCQENKE